MSQDLLCVLKNLKPTYLFMSCRSLKDTLEHPQDLKGWRTFKNRTEEHLYPPEGAVVRGESLLEACSSTWSLLERLGSSPN